MRLLALAGLVVVALGVGLWFLIVRDDAATVAPDAKAAKPTSEAPATAPPGQVQARKAENLGSELKKSIAAAHSTDDVRSAPTLAAEDSGSGSAKVATPEDRMRWAMMRAVRSLEPAIIDCMDAAKKNGEVVSDAIASYGYFFVKKGDDIVLDETSLEYGPFSDSLNTCIKDAGKTMMMEKMPEGATRIKVFSKLTLEKGEIKNLQMPSFHVLEPN